MTIDEAIKHAEEVAKEHTRYNRYGGFESCDECAKEHRQLANWLKELKQLREQKHCENEVCDMAIRSLEMQKKLAEFRGMDICRWSEEYDYEENNISEYEMEASVDDFLIDEVKEEVEKNGQFH